MDKVRLQRTVHLWFHDAISTVHPQASCKPKSSKFLKPRNPNLPTTTKQSHHQTQSPRNETKLKPQHQKSFHSRQLVPLLPHRQQPCSKTPAPSPSTPTSSRRPCTPASHCSPSACPTATSRPFGYRPATTMPRTRAPTGTRAC